MFMKNGIVIKEGQVWSIGKGTQKAVKEANELSYDIGKEVQILNDFTQGLFKVRDLETNIRFDLTTKNLGRLIRE